MLAGVVGTVEWYLWHKKEVNATARARRIHEDAKQTLRAAGDTLREARDALCEARDAVRQAEDVLHAIEDALGQRDLNGRKVQSWGWGSWFGFGYGTANGEDGVVDDARRVYKARDATR